MPDAPTRMSDEEWDGALPMKFRSRPVEHQNRICDFCDHDTFAQFEVVGTYGVDCYTVTLMLCGSHHDSIRRARQAETELRERLREVAVLARAHQEAKAEEEQSGEEAVQHYRSMMAKPADSKEYQEEMQAWYAATEREMAATERAEAALTSLLTACGGEIPRGGDGK